MWKPGISRSQLSRLVGREVIAKGRRFRVTHVLAWILKRTERKNDGEYLIRLIGWGDDGYVRTDVLESEIQEVR